MIHDARYIYTYKVVDNGAYKRVLGNSRGAEGKHTQTHNPGIIAAKLPIAVPEPG